MSTTSTRSKTVPTGVYNEPKYIRPLEAAQRISVTREKIYQLVKSGSLKSYTVGACRLIKVADLDQLVEGNA